MLCLSFESFVEISLRGIECEECTSRPRLLGVDFVASPFGKTMTFAERTKAAMLRALEKPIYARSEQQCGSSEWMLERAALAPWWWMQTAI
jgi:hypothetical protein